MEFDRTFRDAQRCGDLLVAESAAEQLEDIALPRGERNLRFLRCGVAANSPEHSGCGNGCEQRATGGHGSNRGKDLVARRALEEVPGSTRFHCGNDAFVGIEDGEHDNACAGVTRTELLKNGYAIHYGHDEIEEKNVRLVLFDKSERLGTRLGLADHGEVGLCSKHRGQTIAHYRMVIGYCNSNRVETGVGQCAMLPGLTCPTIAP